MLLYLAQRECSVTAGRYDTKLYVSVQQILVLDAAKTLF